MKLQPDQPQVPEGVKRYRPGEEDGVDYGFSEMHPDPDGQWIKVSDLPAIIDAHCEQPVAVVEIARELAEARQKLQAHDAEVKKLRAHLSAASVVLKPETVDGKELAFDVSLAEAITLILKQRDQAEQQLAKVRKLRDELRREARDSKWQLTTQAAWGSVSKRLSTILGEGE